ncbi:hypothetical protein SLEP1_g28770 [Rubroshorea leprosula]|uniref:Uncharacterized protein n=1 Tax=Rubroshorea leprosula TaxID=152421 RepID=A0AAV5K5W0_9ROSI|nr:hypothetical protein SLEP1_g28770 [Rubroshorea leprosula]
MWTSIEGRDLEEKGDTQEFPLEIVFHVKPLLLGQNLVAKKAVKMEAYVSPTMGDVKERKTGFKEKKTLHGCGFDGGFTNTKHKKLKNGIKVVMFDATR